MSLYTVNPICRLYSVGCSLDPCDCFVTTSLHFLALYPLDPAPITTDRGRGMFSAPWGRGQRGARVLGRGAVASTFRSKNFTPFSCGSNWNVLPLCLHVAGSFCCSNLSERPLRKDAPWPRDEGSPSARSRPKSDGVAVSSHHTPLNHFRLSPGV